MLLSFKARPGVHSLCNCYTLYYRRWMVLLTISSKKRLLVAVRGQSLRCSSCTLLAFSKFLSNSLHVGHGLSRIVIPQKLVKNPFEFPEQINELNSLFQCERLIAHFIRFQWTLTDKQLYFPDAVIKNRMLYSGHCDWFPISLKEPWVYAHFHGSSRHS